MSFRLEVPGATFTFSQVDLPAAIRGLREALGKSQEAMATMLECSLRAYQEWELGQLVPDANVLLRMLQICPSEEARSTFRIRPERRSAQRKKPAVPEHLPLSAVERARYRERAHRALDTISECGEAGDQAADLRLSVFADNLHDAAAYYRRARKTRE